MSVVANALTGALGSLARAHGGERLDVAVAELGPGVHDGPYRYLLGNEQWLLVLAGRPTLRHPAGCDELVPGDLVAFPEGPPGARQLTNETSEPARLLVLSTVQRPYVEVRPDTGERRTIES